MESFDQIYNGNTFKFTLNKSESFPKFQIEMFKNNYCYYISRKIIISQPAIEDMIHVFETGDPFLNVSGFEFRDPDRSYLILIKSQTTIIGRTYNLVSGKREDFEVKDIDKKKFLSYLKMANA